MKLFESIMQKFDDDNLGLLGAVLGEHEVKIRDGIEAAVPEILCAIGSQAKSDTGRDMLWRELRDADQSVAESFASQLHYQNSQTLVENGKQQLAGLIGNDIDSITKRVSHAADIGSSSASRMVGVVSPLIFSSLAAWQKKENVNAEGWQRLFTEQDEGLRTRAARAASGRFDESTGQRTFPSFDKTIATDPDRADGKWTASTGYIPGYSNSAKDKFTASAATPASTEVGSSDEDSTSAAQVAASVAGAAAAGGVAANGGTSIGGASSTSAHASSFTANGAAPGVSPKKKPEIDDNLERPRWVPDKENLKKERELAAKEQEREERQRLLAKKNSGGLGWLLWQIPLLAAVAALGWFYKAEISEAINKPATEATAELNFSEESTPVLPSEESSEQQEGGETLDDVQSEESTAAKEITAPKQMSSTNPVDGASEETDAAKSDAVDIEAVNANAADADADSSVLESANDDNTIEQPSSPTTTEGTDSTENVDDISDSPMLEPNAAVESDAAPAADSEPQDSILGVQDSNSDRNGQDVDLQVETALTSLELGMKEIEDEASAKSALPQLEESVARLEDLIKTSDQWNDVDKELIDMQLREATGVFGKLKKSVIGMPDVKSVVTPTFERLEKLLVPQQATAP